MWDDHLTQVEVWSKVKCFPEHVREGLEIDNLEVNVIRERRREEKGQQYISCLGFHVCDEGIRHADPLKAGMQ